MQKHERDLERGDGLLVAAVDKGMGGRFNGNVVRSAQRKPSYKHKQTLLSCGTWQQLSESKAFDLQ